MRKISAIPAILFAIAILVALASLSASATLASPQQSSAPSIVGQWTGILAGQLHLIVTLNKTASGDIAGVLNSVDQGAEIPIESATLSGNAVTFKVGAVGGVFQGMLTPDGNQMSGTWTQTGAPAQPLSFQRSGTSPAPAPAPAASTTAKQPPDTIPTERTPKPVTAPIDIVVPIGPTLFEADGKFHLVYELHVTNLGKYPCTLTRIEVLGDTPDAKSLGTFSGAALAGMTTFPGQPPSQASQMAPDTMSVVYMWVTVDHRSDVPAAIRHRVSMTVGDYPDPITIENPPTPVYRRPVAVISSPLRGDNWLAGNGPSNTSIHRRALIPIDGRAYISQRFAIDWVRLFPQGSTHSGDPKLNKSYRAYGEEIHSVADGVVTEIKDGIIENVPGEAPAVHITLETIGGNHVLMEIGDGLFAFYAHMQPGSVQVKVGDKVRRGQVLGLLGNSGNSTEPHLHFQICNASSELTSEGLPYALPSFDILGKGWSWKSADSHEPPVKIEMQIPTENEVVRFPEAP